MKKNKYLEACLTISMGLLLLWFLFEIKLLLIIAFVIGIIALFIEPVAKGIAWFWYKIADLLGLVISKIILTIIYYALLFPIALLYRLFNKDQLQLKKKPDTYWVNRNHKYSAKDMENVW